LPFRCKEVGFRVMLCTQVHSIKEEVEMDLRKKTNLCNFKCRDRKYKVINH
jgi:hypothetical protein